MEKIVFGKKYKDRVTGIEGIAMAVAEYATGCRRVLLEWAKDGTSHEQWMDETRLQDAGEAPVFYREPLTVVATPAGPASVPPSRDPR